jgi:hypothetical protein
MADGLNKLASTKWTANTGAAREMRLRIVCSKSLQSLTDYCLAAKQCVLGYFINVELALRIMKAERMTAAKRRANIQTFEYAENCNSCF